VGIVGSSVWSLLAFAIHQCRSRPGEEDALYFQQQVVYRNPNSAFGTAVELLSIGWAWRSHRQGSNSERIVQRSALFSLPPLLVFVGFTIAAVFVGDVTRPTYESNNVKILPVNCGILGPNLTALAGGATLSISPILMLNVNETIASRSYARSCYGQSSPTAACSLYPQQSLPYALSNVRCPFGQDTTGRSLCSTESAVMLDTGLLDSSSYLGMNAPSSDRVLFRRSSTCSPVNIDAYTKRGNATDSAGFTTWEYDLGPIKGQTDMTYVYDTHKTVDSIPYQLL
jgi:hypothetical protein